MKKSNKVLLYGLLASIVLILLCLYTHQDVFMNPKKEVVEFNNRNMVQENTIISNKKDIKSNQSIEEVKVEEPKQEEKIGVPVNTATVEVSEEKEDQNKTNIEDENSTVVDTNATNSTVIRTIFKNKEEIKLKDHPKVKVSEVKIKEVDTNLPIVDNKPLIDNDKKESSKAKVVTTKKKEEIKVTTKSLVELQEEISKLTTRNISFYKNKAKITDKSRATLDKVIKILKSVPNAKIVVKGYTDASGKEQTNLWISQERAKSVRRYLGNHGIPFKNIVAKGYGESELLYGDKPNSELNRRVEIEIKRK
jgi:outer membrane protein OmpA-like peptidoglycan-associated protein